VVLSNLFSVLSLFLSVSLVLLPFGRLLLLLPLLWLLPLLSASPPSPSLPLSRGVPDFLSSPSASSGLAHCIKFVSLLRVFSLSRVSRPAVLVLSYTPNLKIA